LENSRAVTLSAVMPSDLLEAKKIMGSTITLGRSSGTLIWLLCS